MKKILMTLAAVLCCAITASAQDAKADRNKTYNIILGNVQYTHHDEKKYEADVQAAIIKGLSSAYRFRYNDALQIGDLAEEGNIVADVIITNIEAKSSTSTWKDTKGKTQVSTTYTGVCEAMISLKDAKTSEVVTNTSFKGQGITTSSFSDADKAICDALDKLTKRITVWLNNYHPLQANIIEGSTAKKEKEVYIDLGSNEGAHAGLQMGVYVIKNIAGREAKSQIGKLKIEAVEGDDISLCKVQSGGKDIKAALDAGQQLRVVSIDK